MRLHKTRRDPSFHRRAELRGPLAAGVATLVAAWAFVAFFPPLHDWLRGDVAFYANWGSWLAGHRLPYRDFALEYPPGALPTFALPPYLRKLFFYYSTYDFWFRVLLLAIGLASLLAMASALDRVGASRRRASSQVSRPRSAPCSTPCGRAMPRGSSWPLSSRSAVSSVHALPSRRRRIPGTRPVACNLLGALGMSFWRAEWNDGRPGLRGALPALAGHRCQFQNFRA